MGAGGYSLLQLYFYNLWDQRHNFDVLSYKPTLHSEPDLVLGVQHTQAVARLSHCLHVQLQVVAQQYPILFIQVEIPLQQVHNLIPATLRAHNQ